jgi:hypothetical protein
MDHRFPTERCSLLRARPPRFLDRRASTSVCAWEPHRTTGFGVTRSSWGPGDWLGMARTGRIRTRNFEPFWTRQHLGIRFQTNLYILKTWSCFTSMKFTPQLSVKGLIITPSSERIARNDRNMWYEITSKVIYLRPVFRSLGVIATYNNCTLVFVNVQLIFLKFTCFQLSGLVLKLSHLFWVQKTHNWLLMIFSHVRVFPNCCTGNCWMLFITT